MKTKAILGKVGMGIAAVGALYSGGVLVGKRMSEIYLPEKAFENMKWCEVYNSDGSLWDNYMGTEIPHNQPNYRTYLEEVKRVNNRENDLSGTLSVPCEKQTSRKTDNS
ncbi:MAG: hypothetical protein U1B79_01515 [Candidatus Pacearchaeota archaeon]|nr:hypothetical protein [Candidatus Pacearchaeota archaeon]